MDGYVVRIQLQLLLSALKNVLYVKSEVVIMKSSAITLLLPMSLNKVSEISWDVPAKQFPNFTINSKGLGLLSERSKEKNAPSQRGNVSAFSSSGLIYLAGR
jgi:hypothetical protein